MTSNRVDDILACLTVEEKVSLLAGGTAWTTKRIPEKGVPSVKLSDGPNGARGVNIEDGATSACFPAACSVASTFDVEISRRIGSALGEESLTKGARCLLGPTVCIHRHPLGGRNFESFSEDPFLTGKMASAYISGLQSEGVSATIKHFAVNEQETRRLTVDAKVSGRALREIYLKPFEIAIKEANPWALMTAYNKINGDHADSNEFLLQTVLRREWGWNGLVMSDWGGTNSTAESLNAGVDLEMPGPSRWRKLEDVMAALEAGKLKKDTINDRSRQVLRFVEQLQGFENPTWEEPEEHSIDKPEHRSLIREAGSKGIVLLKNQDNILPLTKEKVHGKKIGAHTARQFPLISERVKDLQGNPGFTFSVFEKGRSIPEKVTHGHTDSEVSLLRGQNIEHRDITLEGTYHPEVTSRYYFKLSGLGPSQLLVNDVTIFEQKENCSDAMGFLFGGVPIPTIELEMEKDREYQIKIISKSPAVAEDQNLGFLAAHVGVRLGHISALEHDRDILTEAVELAKTVDYAIVFTGHDPTWETEGQDQAGFNLPRDGSQDKLVSAVAAVNPNTIVVNSTGVAVALPWLDQVQGLLQAWFPGQEAGHSIADVLTGALSPEGHLTCSFPKRLQDCPAYGNFPGGFNNYGAPQVEYREGVFVGYRHFDRVPADQLNFPFGFGLSYTTFGIENLSVHETSGGTYQVKATVCNSGDRKGAIAVQVYVGRKVASSEHPVKILAAFEKVALEPGASRDVKLVVRKRDFAFWDERANNWAVETGTYIFSVGKSAGELVATQEVQVESESYTA
ncbi:beta-glucosidase [Colletotrichum truncatum]|uniref:Beta-glucosidase n=1 Tax=Colletotrichum truncatum TaxID=5467 RepID=A0ACC3ZHB1_COLTU